MQILSLPGRFRAAITVLFLLAPLAALEAVLYSRAPYWKLPFRDMLTWGAAAALILLPLGYAMALGRNWAFTTTFLILCSWFGVTLGLALKMKSAALGYFAAAQALASGLVLAWIRFEMGRTFLDARLKWFQGLPKPIPGLYCGLPEKNGKALFRVSRMNEEGVFLFSDENRPNSAEVLNSLRTGTAEMVFDFRNRELHCKGRMARRMRGGRGAGFQFVGMNADHRKEIGDFVETLRGEGYVE